MGLQPNSELFFSSAIHTWKETQNNWLNTEFLAVIIRKADQNPWTLSVSEGSGLKVTSHCWREF